jgi:hypothetical protein
VVTAAARASNFDFVLQQRCGGNGLKHSLDRRACRGQRRERIYSIICQSLACVVLHLAGGAQASHWQNAAGTHRNCPLSRFPVHLTNSSPLFFLFSAEPNSCGVRVVR